jgi:DNA repair protein RadD
MIPLRDYQVEAEDAVRDAMRTDHAVLLVLPTGGGKTILFADIAHKAASKGKRILILAHLDQLIKQASKKLSDIGLPHGIIMAGFTPNPRRNVQVASVQTLVRRVEKMASAGAHFDLIVVDEAHLSSSASFLKILGAWPNARVLGVTGSPVRLDGKGLGRGQGGAFDTIVCGIGIGELIKRGYLVKPAVYASKNQVDLSSVKKIGGDYDNGALADVMDKPVITGSAIAEYRRICPGVPAVAWCASVAHARHVAEEFNASGIPAVAISGDNNSEERDRALSDLSSGRIKVITFAMLLTTGVDCPAIGAVIMLRPTMSLASYLQTIGRGLRPIYASGMPLDTTEQRIAAIDAGTKGRKCFVLDHAGLTFRHGMADEVRDWTLDGVKKKKGKKKDDEPKIDLTQCPSCFVVFDPKLRPAGQEHVCPECGHAIPGKVRKGPEHVDGELAEITPEMEAALKNQKRVEVAQARTLEELEKIAAQRGYSRAWAGHIWNARQRKNTGKSRAF